MVIWGSIVLEDLYGNIKKKMEQICFDLELEISQVFKDLFYEDRDVGIFMCFVQFIVYLVCVDRSDGEYFGFLERWLFVWMQIRI